MTWSVRGRTSSAEQTSTIAFLVSSGAMPPSSMMAYRQTVPGLGEFGTTSAILVDTLFAKYL